MTGSGLTSMVAPLIEVTPAWGVGKNRSAREGEQLLHRVSAVVVQREVVLPGRAVEPRRVAR